MYQEKRIALVIPAHNEADNIGETLAGVPALFDDIFVIDDASTDATAAQVTARREKDPRVKLLSHARNAGVGRSIADGYQAALAQGAEIAVVIGADLQMDLGEVEKFLRPVADGRADYTKGNRFWLYRDDLATMPPLRLLGNTILSLLTKLSSGYYGIFDVVNGYTAISARAIAAIDWRRAWPGYGYPMDFLMRLNLHNFKVMDIPQRTIYRRDRRQSQIRGLAYIVSVLPMLVRNFIHRLLHKYLLRNLHPLAFLYLAGFALSGAGGLLALKLVAVRLLEGGNTITGPSAVLCALLLIAGMQGLLFGMLLDILEDKHNPGNPY